MYKQLFKLNYENLKDLLKWKNWTLINQFIQVSIF